LLLDVLCLRQSVPRGDIHLRGVVVRTYIYCVCEDSRCSGEILSHEFRLASCGK